MSSFNIDGQEITFEWGLQGKTPFEVLTSGESKGYVLKVHWTLSASVGEHVVSTYGEQIFQEKTEEELIADGDTFIPFEELTSQIVFSWLGKSDFANPTKENLAKLLNNVMHPVTQIAEIPWEKTAE